MTTTPPASPPPVPATPRTQPAPRRATRGSARASALQWLVGAALAAAVLALLPLHDDAWWLATPLPRQWLLAAIAAAAYAALCSWALWRARHARQAAADTAMSRSSDATDATGAGTITVAFATQTGFAEAVALRTADSLSGAGRVVRLVDLGDAGADALLQGDAPVLFIASTTGEGDPPDRALRFAQALQRDASPLPALRYAVLALGDRGYARFCAFGHALDATLRRRGAQPLFDLVEVDNGDGAALRHWQHHLGVMVDAPAMPDWTPARYDRWTLAARTRVNAGSPGAPLHALSLRPADGAPMSHWEAGDIAEVGPRNSAGLVDAWLAAHGLDGGLHVPAGDGDDHGDGAASGTLRARLARVRLPALAPASGPAVPPASLAAGDANAIARAIAGFEPLPHREYSVASIPEDGRLDLLVREMRQPDGQPGLGSGWLCLHADVGGDIALRIRRNASFHPPDPSRPLVLVGNGSGLAGLRAHLRRRAMQPAAAAAWLLYGERSRTHDRPHAGEIDGWLRDGVLARCDLMFSRDAGVVAAVDDHAHVDEGAGSSVDANVGTTTGDDTRGPAISAGYVQHALARESARLQDWIDRGAAVMVCGSLAGMAPAVDRVLRDLLGDARVDALLADGRYRRDVY